MLNLIRNSKVFAVLILSAAAFSSYMIAVAMQPEKQGIISDPPPKISAVGGLWSAKELTWTKFNGEWRVSTVLHPRRVKLARIDGHALLKAFCGAILTSLPNAPDPAITRASIYRVTVNAKAEWTGRGRGQSLLFPNDVALPVVDGACLPPPKRGMYFPRFSGDLVHWELREVRFVDDKKTASFSFYPVTPPVNEGIEFSFRQACEAVLSDQPFRPVLESNDTTRGLLDQIDHVLIRLNKPAIDNRLLQIGGFVANKFKVAGKLCVENESSDT